MRQFKVAHRYANALFTLAKEKGQIEEVKKDMDLISSVKNRELDAVIVSPVITSDQKIKIFDSVFGSKISKLSSSFFHLVFSKGRSVALNQIKESFEALYREHKGIEIIKLTTATTVSDTLKEDIRKKVQSLERFRNKTIRLEDNVDASLIGGFILQVGDQLFDASIRNDLRFIKKQFVENMYIMNIR